MFGDDRKISDPWSGFFVGIGASYGFGTFDTSASAGFDHGGIGSILAGYNWRVGNLLYGLEGELSSGALGANVLPGFSGYATNLDYQGALRARMGVLVSPSLLVFGKVGASLAGMTLTENQTAVAVSQSFSGYQVGAGLEYKLSSQLSLRFDYDYNAFSAANVGFTDSSIAVSPAYSSVRLGLSYKF
jgi:outer membrane immunogenic protein